MWHKKINLDKRTFIDANDYSWNEKLRSQGDSMKRPHVLSRSLFPQSPICSGSRNQCVLAPSELRIDHFYQVVHGIGAYGHTHQIVIRHEHLILGKVVCGIQVWVHQLPERV
jgi:hypothetical protein